MESRGVGNVSTYWVCLLQDPKSDLVDLVSLERQSSRTQECVHYECGMDTFECCSCIRRSQ